MSEPIQADSQGVTVSVKVIPRSSRTGVAGVHNGLLKINLTAVPVDGAANEMLIEILAKLCKIRKSDITILSGQTARQKRLRLVGIDLQTACQSLLCN